MKRVIDVVLSGCAILIFSPLLLFISILIRFDSAGPILFRQRRVGRGDTEFMMYKFRTMAVGTPEVATDQLHNSGEYITKIGYYLRKYSIDELPQLWNIINGDMSIVGPRPALYNQSDLRRLRNGNGVSQLLPGLTGWAQINGRDEIDLEKKVQFDYEYLQCQSIVIDLKIIWMTVYSVIAGTGER